MKNISIILLMCVIVLAICACCKPETISEKYNKSPTFKAAPSTTEKMLFTTSTGDLTSYTTNDVFTGGVPVKNWKIYENDSKDLCFRRNDATKDICLSSTDANNYSVKIGSMDVDELSLKKQKHVDLWAGWGMNGEGTTIPFYVGSYKLCCGEWGDAWTNDTIDIVYVNKGFKITLYEHNYTGNTGATRSFENKDSDIPKRFNLGDTNFWDTASSAKAEWVGY